MEQLRSFIAIEMPPEVRKSLSRLQQDLKAGGQQVKWVEPENLHLTLQFLGNINAAKVGDIASAIEKAGTGIRPFRIEVGGLGVFPDIRRINVIWVGLAGELEKLDKLQKNIGANLTPLGFPPETRPFTPHLTIGRVRDFARPEDRAALGRIIAQTDYNVKYKIDATAVNLMKSQLTREGPIYSKLVTITLK
jgi:RNA 2',3'-cyclic 3'-phosphodiesterase